MLSGLEGLNSDQQREIRLKECWKKEIQAQRTKPKYVKKIENLLLTTKNWRHQNIKARAR